MSTQQPKLASKRVSNDEDTHPVSGEGPALRRQTHASAAGSEVDGFSGTCESAALSDWIQLVQMGRRDAVLNVKSCDGKKALLWFSDGDIFDAWCEGSTGEDAVYRALAWGGGQVSITFTPCERSRQIDAATPALLLRAAYRKDSGLHEVKLPSHPNNPMPTSSPIVEFSPVLDSSSMVDSWPMSDSSPMVVQDPWALEPHTEPSVSSRTERFRVRMLVAGALSAVLLLGLAAFWPVKRLSDVRVTAAARGLTNHAEAAPLRATQRAAAAPMRTR